MILVTVGKQLPFDRLVGAVDTLAQQLTEPVIGQVGKSALALQHIKAHAQLSASTFEDLAAEARLIIAHAGVGSVLLARRLRKPIVLLPRRAALGEHRNDHQLATARQLEGAAGVFVAWEETDLGEAIVRAGSSAPVEEGENHSLGRLRQAMASFLASGDLSQG